MTLLSDSGYNWFEFVSVFEQCLGKYHLYPKQLRSRVQSMSDKLNPEETRLLKQSYDAFVNLQQCEEPIQDREIRVWNGDIVSESDSDNPDEYASAVDDSIKRKLVQKKVMQIRRRAKWKRAKELAKKRFLSKKIT